MSVFNRYYQEELLALRELGREYAERNPALAPALGTLGRDPDVERILEAFAFLSGRLRQKLDDELPEITHSLFSLLWPNYLRPIPACSIIQYQPTTQSAFKGTVKRGTLVGAREVEGTSCTFRTVYDADLLPIKISDMRVVEEGNEGVICLRFKTIETPLPSISFSRLRFFLVGDPLVVHTLYFSLVNRLREIRIVLRSDTMEERVVAVLPASNLRPMGFDEDEALYPYPEATFPGYRILQEYFCFPEKFFFVEVSGLEQGLNTEAFHSFHNVADFEIRFVFNELPEAYESFRMDNWRLFCTPVVNLFPLAASPLPLDQRRTEYRIVPEPRQPYHYAVYSVDHVETWKENIIKRRYLPFESFDHEPETGDNVSYYRLRIRPSHGDEGTETYISFVQDIEGSTIPQTETIFLQLTCTNRSLPGKLQVGDICVAKGNPEDSIPFTNIMPVIPSFNPPLEGDILWRLISNMSLNHISLTDVRALRVVLRAYDFRAPYDRPRARVLEKTLKGMLRIVARPCDRIHNGLPVRGTQSRLVLDQRAFSCEGAMFLFASVLNEFLALYATVNSFHQLIVEEASRGEEYTWPARLGNMTI